VSVNIVPILEELLGLLQTFNETKGVPEGGSLSEKNILQNGNSDPNKRVRSSLSSEEQKRTKSIATIFAKTFFEIQKNFKGEDTALKTSVQKITPNANKIASDREGKSDMPKKGLMLGGLLMLLGGAGALIMGLLTDGPFKGVLKILSKIGISGGIKMLASGAKGLINLFSKFVTDPFKAAAKYLNKTSLGKKLVSGAKGLIGMFSKFVSAPFKSISKISGKGFLGKIMKVFKPFAKILKKIPIIGNIISIGFAISRFMKGDNIGGVIDVLSALAGLLNLIPGGSFIAIPLSIGLDILNAWLDSKTEGAENKNTAKMDILKDMGKSVGDWIWKNALWLPVIGGFKRWGMAYDAFKGGNIMEGLKQFGLGILSFVGMGPIIMGIETLMGFFGDKEEKKDLKPSTSWFGRIKEWVQNKLKKLPSFLRKPLEWFGIIDDSSESEPNMEPSQKIDVGQKIVEWFSSLWGKITPMLDNIGKWFSGLWEKISTWASGLWEKMTPALENIGKWFSGLWEKIKEFLGSDFVTGIIEKVKNIATSVMSVITNIFDTLKNVINNVIDTIKSFNIFGSGGDDELLGRAKKMGWNSVEEYKNSGWLENPNKSGVEIVDEKRKQHVDDLLSIGKEQISILSDIRRIGMETLKVLSSNAGGGSSNPIIISNSGGGSNSKPSSQISLNTSRGDYSSSPYAFA
jgi:hypothetical protein